MPIFLSPKDSCYDLENAALCSLLEMRIKELYASPSGSALLARGDTENDRLLTNEEMIIFFQSANERLRAASGKEAMEVGPLPS